MLNFKVVKLICAIFLILIFNISCKQNGKNEDQNNNNSLTKNQLINDSTKKDLEDKEKIFLEEIRNNDENVYYMGPEAELAFESGNLGENIDEAEIEEILNQYINTKQNNANSNKSSEYNFLKKEAGSPFIKNDCKTPAFKQTINRILFNDLNNAFYAIIAELFVRYFYNV